MLRSVLALSTLAALTTWTAPAFASVHHSTHHHARRYHHHHHHHHHHFGRHAVAAHHHRHPRHRLALRRHRRSAEAHRHGRYRHEFARWTWRKTAAGDAAPSGAPAIGRPRHYIARRLGCAINVNAALAARGIRGTGSALAKSFLHWGHASRPVPGAVAVYSRRGGGHAAIVSRVANGRVYVWNPGRHGWREVAYPRRAISYRVAG